ncbi:hypothetical protein ACJ41O_014830 [Fusarium nematophilum]
MRPPKPTTRDDFEIAIICALTLEADAVIAQFDHHWDEDDHRAYGKARGDPNAYSVGVIGHHNVVLAHLPGMGKVAAGNIAAFCRMSFPNVKIALVVGICGGAPSYGQRQILLGDVVISDDVIQYDFGRRFPDRFETKDTSSDGLGRPNLEIRSLLSKLKTARQGERLRNAACEHLNALPRDSIKYPGRSKDHVFPAGYRHKHQDPSLCALCASCTQKSDPVCQAALTLSCEELGCDFSNHRPRSRLSEGEEDVPCPVIHFGRIASGDTVMKSGEDRDDLVREKQAIAFEMESVGVWDIFPCVVIKAVCDYADSHKNKEWQAYAAASAAACTKAFLEHWASTTRELQAEIEAKERSDRLLQSLKFPEMNARRNDISSNSPDTFNWIFGPESELSYDDSASESSWDSEPNEQPTWSFTDWLESDTAVYWISGKPASGKSTLMKFIAFDRRTAECLEKWKHGALVLTHFFWKPGSMMQRSLKGFLCSLLHQILSKDNDFLRQNLGSLVNDYDKHSPSDWDVHDLWSLLLEYGKQPSWPLCIFIDALDEISPEDDAHKLMRLVGMLPSSQIKICVSSRPDRFFELQLQQYPSLKIQELTARDVEKYVRKTIRDATQPSTWTNSTLATQIAQRADGVFLWAVLVTRSLIRGINNGDTEEEIHHRLDVMPGGLMALYRDILLRSDEDRNIYEKKASMLLSLLVFNEFRSKYTGPSVLELMVALDDATLDSYLGRNERLPVTELNKKCEKTLSTIKVGCGGLLEVDGLDFYRHPGDNPGISSLRGWGYTKTRFIHRTAADFLIDAEEGQSIWRGSGLSESESISREIKSEICLAQVTSLLGMISFPSSVDSLLDQLVTFQDKLPPEMFTSLFSQVQVNFTRGYLLITANYPARIRFSQDQDEFLLVASEHGFHEYVIQRLRDYKAPIASDMSYRILRLCCERPTFDSGFQSRGQHHLIEHFLNHGLDPNSTTPAWPTRAGSTKTSFPIEVPFFSYLLSSRSSGHYLSNADSAQLVLSALRAFLDAGSSLSSRIELLVRFRLDGPSSFILIEALEHHDRPANDDFFVILEANAQALLDIVLGHIDMDSELEIDRVDPFIRATAFGSLEAEHTQFAVESDERSARLVKVLTPWLVDRGSGLVAGEIEARTRSGLLAAFEEITRLEKPVSVASLERRDKHAQPTLLRRMFGNLWR